jgi:uncharacterized protein
LRLVDPGSGRVLAARLRRPRTFLGRGLGLMFRASLPAGEGMWIVPCNGIHTFFMRFPIDVLFLDRDQRLVRAFPRLRPWRMVPFVRGSRSVVELPAGTLDSLQLSGVDRLGIEGASGAAS